MTKDPAASASVSSVASVASTYGIPKPPEAIASVLNPNHEAPYSGPTGRVHGRITIKGDAPPDTNFTFGPGCEDGQARYGKLFRVGPKGELADAMVAVTRYKGVVSPTEPARKVSITKCAFDTRTIVASFGQRIDVSNFDSTTVPPGGTPSSYMPYLDGAPFRAMIVALPQARPVQLYPLEPGHYLLRDILPHPYMIADVFVLPYPTFDVTQTDGVYSVSGIPVGPARIDTFLPVIGKSIGKDIDVVEGDNVIDLELTYSAATDKAVVVPSAIWGDRRPPSTPPTAQP